MDFSGYMIFTKPFSTLFTYIYCTAILYTCIYCIYTYTIKHSQKELWYNKTQPKRVVSSVVQTPTASSTHVLYATLASFARHSSLLPVLSFSPTLSCVCLFVGLCVCVCVSHWTSSSSMISCSFTSSSASSNCSVCVCVCVCHQQQRLLKLYTYDL